jgi:hypothetical protein
MRLLFLIALQYTHILCRVSEHRSQDRVPKFDGYFGCCSTPGESSPMLRLARARRRRNYSLLVGDARYLSCVYHSGCGDVAPHCHRRRCRSPAAQPQMRIVLDTNILVRANAKVRGPARELLQLIVGSPDHVLLLSPFLQQELERVFLTSASELRRSSRTGRSLNTSAIFEQKTFQRLFSRPRTSCRACRP